MKSFQSKRKNRDVHAKKRNALKCIAIAFPIIGHAVKLVNAAIASMIVHMRKKCNKRDRRSRIKEREGGQVLGATARKLSA